MTSRKFIIIVGIVSAFLATSSWYYWLTAKDADSAFCVLAALTTGYTLASIVIFQLNKYLFNDK